MAKINKDDLTIGVTFTPCSECKRVEMVHAHWDEDGRCSHCKEEAITEWNEVGGGHIFTRFCPFCGAVMDGGNEDGK